VVFIRRTFYKVHKVSW